MILVDGSCLFNVRQCKSDGGGGVRLDLLSLALKCLCQLSKEFLQLTIRPTPSTSCWV